MLYGSATFTPLAQQFGFYMHRAPENVPFAKQHYTGLLKDMLGTLNRHLAEHEYVAGDYAVADISMFPNLHRHGVNTIGLTDYPNVKRRHDSIETRAAVQRARGPY
jgi:glutathione S-transferase